MVQVKSKEKSILIVEFMVILFLCAGTWVAYGLFHDQLHDWVEPGLWMPIYLLVLLLLLLAAFVMLNTSYYSYASYGSRAMLIFSTFSGVLSLSIFYYFIDMFMFYQQNDIVSYELGGGAIKISFICLTFVVGLVLVARQNDQAELVTLKHLDYLLPWVIAVILLVLNIYIVEYFALTLSKQVSQMSIIVMDWASLLVLLALFTVDIYRYFSTGERYQIRMATGSFLFFSAYVFKLFPGTSDLVEISVFSVFLFLAMLSYVYTIFKYNITIPIKQQKNAELQVALYAENLEKVVQKRTNEIRAVNATFIRDLEYAKSIQQSLLPSRTLDFKVARFVSAYYPCERLSGDFFDIFMIDQETIGMYILDVSGHGIPAALMTMFCMNYIKSSERLINQFRGKKPHRNLKHFFDEFNKVNFPDEMHMVMFFASYESKTRTLIYCSGGMNCVPLLVRKTGQVEKLDQSVGFPICKVGNFFTPEFHSAKIELQVGDRVIFYTDGLTDIGKNLVFDDQQLVHVMKKHVSDSLETLKEDIMSPLSDIVNKLDDDITFFIMEVQ